MTGKALARFVRLILLVSALFGLGSQALSAQAPTVSDLNFGTHELALDVYLPSGVGPFPVLVLCHGGAYVSGDKREFHRLGATLARTGISVVAINYRLGSVPDAETETEAVSMVYSDVVEAFSWIKGHENEFGLDSDRVFVGGGSSGGHLSIATGILYPKEKRKEVNLRGVVGLYGGYFTENIDGNSTPLLILQGTDDRACLPEASRFMAKLYWSAGAWCRLVIIEGMIHDWGGKAYYDQLVDQIRDFVTRSRGDLPPAEEAFLPRG